MHKYGPTVAVHRASLTHFFKNPPVLFCAVPKVQNHLQQIVFNKFRSSPQIKD
jgi:hypothetical protein